jgi:hypothetical protein
MTKTTWKRPIKISILAHAQRLEKKTKKNLLG